MAMAICHKSLMGGKTEASFWLSSNSSTMPSSRTNEDNASCLTHTYRVVKQIDKLCSFREFCCLFFVLFAVRVKCNKQTTNERKNEQSNDEQIDNMPPVPHCCPRPRPHLRPFQAAVVPHFCALFFLFAIFRFPRMIDCCCPNIPSYLFCIWQIYAHPLAANV